MASSLSAELLEARLGNLTASRMAEALARTKSGWGAGRAKVMCELVIERLTLQPLETFQNDAMRWGIETEPQALSALEWHLDVEIVPTGYVPHPTIPRAGATPDGKIVGRNETVECKCPNSATHAATLLSGRADPRYEMQMAWQMACMPESTGVWFVSFDPRFPPRLQLFTTFVARDDKRIAQLEADAREFLDELDQMVLKLEQLNTERAHEL